MRKSKKIEDSEVISELRQTVYNILNYLEEEYGKNKGKNITLDDTQELIINLVTILPQFMEKESKYCTLTIKKRVLPLLNLMIRIDKDENRKAKYMEMLEETYRICASDDFSCFLVYYEWEEDEKLFETRYNILNSYVYYLNVMAHDPTFELIIANLPSGYGKLLADDTPVLTKNGWKNHGDLTTNDYVLSPNGKWVKVLQIHPKGIANVKITFSDGEEFYCHNNHEWYLYDRHTQKNKVIETNDLLKTFKDKDGRNRYLLPFNEYLIGEKKELAVDPYTYGVWLGDGTNKQARICSSEKDRIVIDELPYEISSTHIHKDTGVIYNTYKNLRHDLQKLGLCYWNRHSKKYIHESYLTASVEQRLQLLAGLLDTDGYLNQKENKYSYTTCEEKLRDTFVELCATFNWRCSVTSVEPKTSTSGIKGQKTIYYISFRPDCFIPCKLKRKQLINYSKKKHITIENVEFISDIKQGNCISVEGELYCVGKKLKVTHNSRMVKLYEAWRLGLDSKGTFLDLCSNDTVVKGGSRSVIDIIKNERYGNVFPNLSYQQFGKDLFLKETDGEWKIKDCQMLATYYASTTNSNVVGQRASLSIHIDDLYADYKEALDENLNMYYFNKYLTVWRKRYVQNKTPQVIISGTMWSPTDFIVKVIDLEQSESVFKRHPHFKYTKISEDGKKVIIQVPALDPETDLSTCEELRSTEALHKERRSMDTYLWETNFQQNPTTPEGLDFDWKNIDTYDEKPINEYGCCYAVIDGTRKSGKDFFAMPIYQNYYEKYAMIDCIFTKVATSELIDSIIEKIIKHHIVKLVIETNVDGGLKRTLEEKLHKLGVYFCVIIEKYNTVPKKIRIESEKGNIVKKIVYPSKKALEPNTDMARYMGNLTLYNSSGRNANDDAPDSSAMFTSEIIGEKSKLPKVKPMKRPF